MTNSRHLKIPILLSIGAAVVTMGLKGTAWVLTGSVGLLSDAAESVVNLVAAGIAYLSIHYASRPVDRSHTYGHEKIAYFSSGLEGALIAVAAGVIGYTSIQRLLHAEPLAALDLGLGLALIASLLNLAVAILLIRTGRRYHSIVLEADGQHLMTDVWTSAAVLLGLGLVWLTGWMWLDPVVALLMAGNILWTGFALVRRSFDGLMDRALPDEDVQRIRAVIQGCLSPGMAFHALRTRRASPRLFADFHVLVPGAMSVQAAHDVVEKIEEALRTAYPLLEATIHLEPIEAQEAWHDSALLPLERGAAPREG